MLGSSLQHISVELLLPVPQEFPYHLPAQAFPLQDEVSHPHRSVRQETSLDQILDTLLWLPAEREEVGEIVGPLELCLVPFLELIWGPTNQGFRELRLYNVVTAQEEAPFPFHRVSKFQGILTLISSFSGGIPQLEENKYRNENLLSARIVPETIRVLRKGLSSRPDCISGPSGQGRSE